MFCYFLKRFLSETSIDNFSLRDVRASIILGLLSRASIAIPALLSNITREKISSDYRKKVVIMNNHDKRDDRIYKTPRPYISMLSKT